MIISRRNLFKSTACTAVACAFIKRTQAQTAEYTYKYGNNVPASHPLNVRAQEAAERIKAETGGKFELKVFPNNQLGGDTDVLNQLRSGAVEFIADGQLALFSTWCPAGTGIERRVTVEGHRWAIEDAFETAKTELGLDHNETRSWHGWHRHVSLAMLAFAMMAVVRHHANQLPPPKKTKGRVGRAAR